ncbi:MAG TPA: hypothetical protein VFD59_14740 [Nocardioidaceae bacterium]|nr:hypothetical protein [Nocardioidaceae bacterium]
MDTVQVVTDIDPISMRDVASLGSVDGPCVSLFLSTHRFGPETTTQDPVRLRNLVEAARSALSDAGTEHPVIDEILAPVSALVDDSSFWPHQSGGLAVFSGRGSVRTLPGAADVGRGGDRGRIVPGPPPARFGARR